MNMAKNGKDFNNIFKEEPKIKLKIDFTEDLRDYKLKNTLTNKIKFEEIYQSSKFIFNIFLKIV
jgi:hypothetical protein